ncbi:hypothetical protein AB0F52_45995 [Amycolatopsis sp. NPDC024027]|uniref:hypothetical protein n=1 Tax=Amycolatopsis sp. NPDC024027 TaxID=3154327 RepID=UPI00340F4DC9
MPLDELRALVPRHARPDLRTDIDAARIFRVDRRTPPTPSTYSKVPALVAQDTNGSRSASAYMSI